MTQKSDAVGSSRRDDLDAMLAETVFAARQRESTTFDDAAGDRETAIVLFGAGGLGRRTLAGLRRSDVEPIAFADNNQSLWGSEIDGVAVLSPENAARQFSNSATFVVSIWGAGRPHRFAHSVTQLSTLGCDAIVPIAWLYWRYTAELLPYYALDLPSHVVAQADAVRSAFDLLSDEQSQQEFVDQVRWRLGGDPSCLSHPVVGPQYLLTDVAAPRPDEVILDCGAYDGDTLRSWMSERGPSFAAYFAMEPDPDSRARLQETVQALPHGIKDRVRVLPYAASLETGKLRFAATGLPSASVEESGELVVDGIRLDDLGDRLEGHQPTFLKMDVEGAELDALEGGSELIAGARPLMTLSSYHRQDHLWRIPLKAAQLWPEYRQFVRPHNEEAWDLILYTVPPERELQP